MMDRMDGVDPRERLKAALSRCDFTAEHEAEVRGLFRSSLLLDPDCQLLMTACKSGGGQAPRVLLDCVDYSPSQMGAVLWEVSGCDANAPAMRALLSAGASLLDDFGDNLALYNAAYDGQVQCLGALLEAGADVDATTSVDAHSEDVDACSDEADDTPLRAAACRGHLAVVVALLDAGASVDLANSDGNTPMSSAAAHGHIDVARTLLLHGADPHRVLLQHVADIGVQRLISASRRLA
jgi:hypothetical protein